MNDTAEVIVAILFVVIVVLGIILSAGLQPYFEAKTFNECTGGNASYWDAAFAELRVQNCTKK